jgi:hypothetical protein
MTFPVITDDVCRRYVARARAEGRNPIRERIAFLTLQFLSAPLLRPAGYLAGGSHDRAVTTAILSVPVSPKSTEGNPGNGDARRLQDPFSAEKPHRQNVY